MNCNHYSKTILALYICERNSMMFKEMVWLPQLSGIFKMFYLQLMYVVFPNISTLKYVPQRMQSVCPHRNVFTNAPSTVTHPSHWLDITQMPTTPTERWIKWGSTQVHDLPQEGVKFLIMRPDWTLNTMLGEWHQIKEPHADWLHDLIG